jgi:hypothetical protein
MGSAGARPSGVRHSRLRPLHLMDGSLSQSEGVALAEAMSIHSSKIRYRQNRLTLTRSAYARVAAVIAGSIRASSRPVSRPAAKTRAGFDR